MKLLNLKSERHCAPGKATTNPLKHKGLASLQTTIAARCIEGQGD
jgi:hypothetical protein